ncbi:6797_t:CDS:2, partial [Funneliformis geosporum]
LKSPRIEINVVADTVLAIYLLNFQTAQQNNDPSHPLFLKCIRLHKFMTMIYETDELLKKHIFHKVSKENSKLQLYRIAISNGITSSLNRLELLKQLWDPLEQSLMRQNIDIWYDKAKFDILIFGEQSSTNKSVKRTSDNNAYSALKERLKVAWSAFAFSEKVFVKAFHPLGGDKILPISFCELRFNKELGSLVTGNLSFFNVEVFQRQKALEDLINLINELNSNQDGDGQLYYVCKRPISSFIVKNPGNVRHENEISSDNRHVTGQDCIVKSYLRHWRWTWLSDIEHIFSMDSKNMPIQDLAFQHLCQARRDEGCLLISENSNQKVFYRELELGGNSDLGSSANQNRLYGIQHHIYKDSYTGEIITEIWMEPLQQPFLRDFYESVADRVSTADRQKISQLVTFDQIHYIAKSRVSHLRNSHSLTPQKSSHLPSLFNLPVLLKSSGLLIANYDIPSFKSSSNIINNQFHQYLHLQSVKSSYMSNENTPRSSFGDSRSPLISESSSYIRKGSISNRNSPYMEVAQRKLSLSLPNNPTHDVTYIISRDLIAPLGPLDRDFALLHLFVEKTFSNYADGEVDTNNNGLKDSLLREINSGLSKIDFLQEATSTIEYIKNLRDTRCFIKIVDPGSFLLVIIPSFKLLLDIMKQNNGLISNKPCFMSILIFLCKRPQPIQSDFIKGPADFRRDQTLSFETISLLNKAPNTIKNSLEPKLLSSSFPENPVNSFKSDLSDQAAQVTLSITKLYVHGFVKSVYASILQKHRVTETDFLKAIDACMETSVDIDITGYVNVHVKATRQGLDSDDANDVYQKFVAVLGHYFEPANFINDELQNIYYYRPNFKKPNNSSIDTHDNVADIAGTFLDVFNYAENPLFLRLECTFKKTSTPKVEEDIELEGSSSVKFPISSLPTSYLCTVDGKSHDFSPKSIGTETSPVESSDGTTAILHLICLTLARVDEMAPGVNVDDNVTRALESTNEILPQLDSLTADKKEALSETRDRIDWLLKEEMMHGLLRSQPVEKSVLSFIQKQLMPKNPFVDFPTTFSVPLSFVRRKQGQDRFLKEFSKADMSPFSLNQVEDCFYISEDEEKGESLAVVDNSRVTSPVFELSLGISIYTPDENDIIPDHADQTIKSVKKHVIHKQLFWLLLIPQENSIQMYFYSKAVSAIERSNIIKHVRSCIVQISERINRLILLDELNETRRCSKYLVPPDGSSDSESSSEDSDLSSGDLVDVLSMAPNDGNITVSKKFKPGQFECESVYKQTFPIHWRLRPNQALNGIASSILDPFVVSNRKHMFVIAKNQNIVYLKLSEVEASPVYIDDESLDDSSRPNSSSFALSSELQSNADELRKSPSSKSGGSPNTSSPNSRKHGTQTRVADSRELVVEVYGLDVPGKEITEELMALLENKLNSSITLTVMSTFLARNPYKVNPTRADVNFIFPIRETPRRISLKIPSYIRNTYAFLVYFKQNISLYLNVLQGPEVTNAIRRHHISKYGSVEFPESTPENGRKTPSATHDIHFHEFTFFYNYISQSRAPSAFEASVGQGIAGLCFTLLNRQGRPTFELLVPDIVDSDDISSNKILHYLSNDEAFVVSDSTKDSNDNIIDASYQILIELWNHGSLNYNIILDRIKKSFRQSLCDYFIEVSITKGLGRVSLDCVESNNIQVSQNFDRDDTISPESLTECVEPHVQHNFIEPALALLKKAVELENPALHALHARLDMPSWMMDDFLSEVHELLVELNIIFTPIILRTIPASLSPMYEIYRPKHSISTPDDSIAVPRQYLLIAGLKEMNTKYGSCKSILPDDRRGSFGSDMSHSRRSSTEDISNEKANANSRKSSLMSVAAQQRHLLEEIMMYTISNCDQTNRNTPDLFRSCFLVMSINGFDLSVYIYNWVKQHADQVFTAMKRISDWHNKRIGLLNNILHQKMGLFYHSSNISVKLQPQTPFSQSLPNTPRPMQSPMLGTILNGQRSNAMISSNGHSMATDLMHINSLILERFPQQDNKKSSESCNDVFNSYSTDLEANRFSLTSLDLNVVLKDSCVEKVARSDISHVGRDALMRHGIPFMETYIRQAKITQAHDNAEKVYKKWAKRYQENKDHSDTNEVIAKSDLAIIFRTSRLLHFCRTPLLFGEKVESSVTLPEQDKIMVSKWYEDMVENFLQKYSAYLERIGMQVVMGGNSGLSLVDDGDKSFSNYTSKFPASDNNVLADYSSVFLLKALQGGSIMCEVRIQGVFVCVTLYTLNRRYGHRNLAAPEFVAADTDRHSIRVFTEECGKFKKTIHVNSFVYDFHLQYINHVLEGQLRSPPPFNVIEILRAFIRRHSQPAHYAVHRIYHDIVSKELPSIPIDLFEYIVKNPQRYGFSSISYEGKPIACFATLGEVNETSSSIETDQNKDSCDNDSSHSTIIFTEEYQSDKNVARNISLEYFVIVLHNDVIESSFEAENTVGSSESHNHNRHLTDLTHLDIQDEIKNLSRKKLDSIISQAIQYHRRDSLWRELYHVKTNSNSAGNSSNDGAITIQDFLELTNQWYSRELVTIYPDFKDFLDMDLNWTELLNFLSHYYNELSRELYDEGNHQRHLIIFNTHIHDSLLHFILPYFKQNDNESTNNNGGNDKVVVNAVCRDVRRNFGIELQFAAEIVRTIGYWLWQKLS